MSCIFISCSAFDSKGSLPPHIYIYICIGTYAYRGNRDQFSVDIHSNHATNRIPGLKDRERHINGYSS